MTDQDLIAFLFDNRQEIKDKLRPLQMLHPLAYYYEEQYKENVKSVIKGVLLDHFPDQLELITLTVDDKLVKLVFGV